MSETDLNDSYKSIETKSEGIYKESGSKFLSYAFPLTEEEELKDILDSVKKEHYSARHHCFAYRLGREGDIWRMNDDGEPSSSAGKPIYGQILSNELSDILIIVVRYFGGTKLGIPGLIRAYKSAAADAIANNKIITKITRERITFSFDYINMESVMKLIKRYDPILTKQNFDLRCSFSLRVRLSDYQEFLNSLKDIEGVTIEQPLQDN
jgi:uncharacterized YigZ family protein